MKRVVTLIVIFALLTPLFAQDVEINRGQLWTRLTVTPTFEKGFGAYLSAGMRDNFSITKEVNGNEKPATEQNFWLKEMMIGPSWGTKAGKRSSFKTLLLYRPQFWFPDNSGGDSYLRHTIMSSNNFFSKFNRITIHQRAMLWGQFETAQGENQFDNELIFRYLVGPEFAFNKKVSISVKAEPFLKLTADDDDLDGTELLNRFATWTGVTVKPMKDLKLSLSYVNMQIYPKENIHIKDHYIYAHVTYAPKIKSSTK